MELQDEQIKYKDLCVFCFDVLIDHLKNNKKEAEFPLHFKGKSYPIFVTWTTGEEKDLRGCIGTFAQAELDKILKKYALISALRDTRFDPISFDEVPSLHVGVSLLTAFEECEHPLDWEVGRHGVEIDFEHRNRNFSATFLPEVAEEQNWDQKTTLKYLVNKAGYSGSLEVVMEKIKMKRYQSIKTYLSFNEYLEIRKIGRI